MTARKSARLGRYRLVKRLAGGGMAEVYLARCEGAGGFERDVVLKRIRPDLAQSEEYVRMLLDEARIAATLNHPNIVQAFDVEEVDGEYFIAMEYLDGIDLRNVQKRLEARGGGALPLENTVHIVVALADGLEHAHRMRDAEGRHLRIVHRDVSPHNVLLSREGGVVLVDFGIAKAENREAETIHGTGLKGKLGYMSPEQVRGESLDHRSDLFSLGIILYELTTGSFLFSGRPEHAILLEIAEGRVPLPSERDPDYPRELERIAMRLLAARPEERYASAGEVQGDLEAFARQRGLALSTRSLARLVADLADEPVQVDERGRTYTPWVANLALKAGAAELSLDEALDALSEDDSPAPAVREGSGATALDIPSSPPAPAPAPAPAASARELSGELRVGDAAGGKAAAPTQGGARAGEPSRGQTAPSAASAGSAAFAASADPGPAEPAPELRPGRRGLWLATLGLLAVAAAAAYVLWDGGELAAVLGREADAGAESEPPLPEGSIRVAGDPAGAGVWLHLGAAPATSMPLPTDRPHQIRVHREGYAPYDIDVAPSRWTERAGEVGVWIEARLDSEAEDSGAADRLPEPPEQDDSFEPIGRGQGRIRVAAEPADADVWLLIGALPDAALDGVRADTAYRVRVAKPGFEPEEIEIGPDAFERAEAAAAGGADSAPGIARVEVDLD